MIVKALLFFGLFFSFYSLVAQDKKEEINIKQRFLQRKSDDPKEAIDSFHSLHLMIAGNLYQTEKHVNYAYDQSTGRYNFKEEFKYIEPLLNLGDISIVNLKTSFGDNINNMFSAPDEFALAIKYSGINALMHANMHTANIDKATLKRTRDVLNDYDMFHTGAFVDQAERLGNYPLIINKKGFRIAILNYTKLPSRPSSSREFVINELDKFYIDRDMRMAIANKPDFIIAYFDWSDNFQDIPNHAQQEMARYVFEKGVDLVVGACPNNPMRIDYMDYFYNGVAREGIVAYSLGNLIASNEDLKNRNGYVIDMELKKNSFTGETKVDDWGVVPVYTYYDTSSVRGVTKVYSLPCWAIESGDIFPGIPYIEKRRAVNSAYGIRKLLGANADEVQYNMTEQVVNNVAESILITSASLNNKFSQAREQDLKPSPAPVLPVYAEGTTMSPSLAAVYSETNSSPSTQMTGAGGKSEITYSKEKKSAENVFAGNSGNGGNQPDKTITDSKAVQAGTTAVTATPVDGAVAGPAAVSNAAANNQTPVTNNLNDKVTGRISEPYGNSTTGGKGLPGGGNSSGKSVENEAGSSATNRVNGNPHVDTAGVNYNSEVKGDAIVMSTGKGNNNVAPNTNYHTTGNKYELNDPDNTAKNKNVIAAKPKQRTPETGADISVAEPATEITTKTVPQIKADTTRIMGKQLKLQVDTFYRIQFYALSRYLPLDTNYYTHLKGYEVYEDKGMFKYVLGKYQSYKECYNYWKTQIQPRYKESFIVKYIDGKRILE